MKCPNCGYVIDSKDLTARELEVEKLLVEGLRPQAIAEKLFISARTVEVHQQAVYRKRGVHSHVQLVRLALLPKPKDP